MEIIGSISYLQLKVFLYVGIIIVHAIEVVLQVVSIRLEAVRKNVGNLLV